MSLPPTGVHKTDTVFAGSVPRFYDTYMVPLIFEPYAADLARRVASLNPQSVLEIAAGTGVVTRAVTRALPATAAIVATDLNQAMLDHARSVDSPPNVEWRQADALNLPFGDDSFDVVICQFGVMFFPDRTKAFAEARRVLKHGGAFIFNTWDRISENEFADVVTSSLAGLYPLDPPRFLARTPHGYTNRATIDRDLRQAGFAGIGEVETISARSRAESPRIPAVAYCEGTPLRDEIEARNSSGLDEAVETATQAIVERFGSGEVDSKIQAHVIVAFKE